jgi:hypothetical protein
LLSYFVLSGHLLLSSQLLHVYDPEIKPFILNMFHRLTALTFDISRSHNLLEAKCLNQIIEATFNMKNGLGLGIQKGGYSGDTKYEYAKRFLKEKEVIDITYNKLFEIYADRKLL